ncbi:MAG: sulfite oxidase-like oxidoreductase [Shinella sp.]|nr:sulfite oxidase-like oxidoreductase [Shinella sp.]
MGDKCERVRELSETLRPRIPPNQVVTRKFPVMTAGTARTATKEDWTLTLDGAVENPVTLDWNAFRTLPQQDFTVDIHCVTRWSKLDTNWRGVSIQALADLVKPQIEACYVSARADGGYSTNLRLVDLIGGKAFVGTEYEGAPLSEEHGGPARLVVPDLYFWKSAKWLRGLHFSLYDYKGYWEKLGYHNYGDPWKEQRYRG